MYGYVLFATEIAVGWKVSNELLIRGPQESISTSKTYPSASNLALGRVSCPWTVQNSAPGAVPGTYRVNDACVRVCVCVCRFLIF